MVPTAIHSSPRAYTSTAAGMTDADGIVTLLATQAVASVVNGAGLNGAVQAAGFQFPRYITVTTTVDAATYNTAEPIVVTGTRGGAVATVSLTLTAAGGGETITSATPLDSVTSIAIPAQLGAAGEFTFGVVDMGCPFDANGGETPFREVKVNGDGNLVVQFLDGSVVTVPCLTGDHETFIVRRIYGTSTCTPIVAYV
jgi:hypothetical protein